MSLSYRVCYLTADAARRCFGRDGMEGLPVVPAAACADNPDYFDAVYELSTGNFVCGVLCKDDLTVEKPTGGAAAKAVKNYFAHYRMMCARFGADYNPNPPANVAALLGKRRGGEAT